MLNNQYNKIRQMTPEKTILKTGSLFITILIRFRTGITRKGKRHVMLFHSGYEAPRHLITAIWQE
jgi:hypothetical protein